MKTEDGVTITAKDIFFGIARLIGYVVAAVFWGAVLICGTVHWIKATFTS